MKWNLLVAKDVKTFKSAIAALRAHLDPASKTIAAQDFWHTVQKENKSIADFAIGLEKTFQNSYRRDKRSMEN